MRALLAVSLVLSPLLAEAADAGRVLEVWTRRAGKHAGFSRGRDGLSAVDLSKLPQEERTLADAQLGETHKYRGVPLAAVLQAAPPGVEPDLVLLHFRNGMLVPVPFRDARAMGRLDVFVALAVEVEENGKKSFTASFPPLRKKGAESRDARPIFFDGNKVVVKTRWLPAVGLEGADAFSPWAHVDRLEGLEYVKADAWRKQFTFGDAQLQKGLDVFLSRCAFCHGLRKVGADFGWDFAEPIPIADIRPAQALVLHARYREGDAPERGLMMPSVKEFSDADAKLLWKWLKVAGAAEPKPYEP
jgi:mono/diheme cytochrome c family protein